jgi:serine/threonine protein kinase
MAIDHPHDALPPGFKLGDYEILRVLGRGGFGFTYQARRLDVSGDMVAIKELFPHATAYRTSNHHVVARSGASQHEIDSIIEMFARESKVICSLRHPNIAQGIEAFRANNTAYLVMRYISGRNLRDSLRDSNGYRASPSTLPRLMIPLLDALETLHQHGLLHCDIKPDNIFLGVGYEPILIDLGSARWHISDVATEESSTYSHYFSAVEQLSDRFGSIGPWTDIYQLSAVMYRCISGGKLPDSMDRLNPSGDPYLPLHDIKESVIYPKALINGIDSGLRLLPKNRPKSIAEWRKAMELTQPSLPAHEKPQRVASNTPLPPLPVPPQQQQPPAIQHTVATTISPNSSPDLLLWLAGALLAVILIIVLIIVNQ